MNHFQEDIKKWVTLDSQLKALTYKSKEIRNEKNELSDNIMKQKYGYTIFEVKRKR